LNVISSKLVENQKRGSPSRIATKQTPFQSKTAQMRDADWIRLVSCCAKTPFAEKLVKRKKPYPDGGLRVIDHVARHPTRPGQFAEDELSSRQ
jgi:hypothetical protein